MSSNELHALAKSQRGPFPSAGPIAVVSQWLGFLSESVKQWQALVAGGADPNAVDKNGRTPLHEASARGNWQAVDYLLRAGLVTKINARDRWGRTALDLAIVGGHKEVEVLLSAHEAIAVAREEEEPCDLLPACEKPPRGCPLLQMPTEMLVLILSWLEPRDLCAVAQTCSALEEASRDNALWRRFCDEEHALPGGQSWKDCYREWCVPHLRAYAAAGKRCLIERYVYDKFRSRRSHIGVDVYMKETHMGDRRLMLHLFHLSTTFMSHEPRVSFPRIFYREAVGLVYVYDVTRRDSLNVLPQRHQEIVQHFPDGVPPIILVGTKVDLIDASSAARPCKREVSEEKARAMARRLNAVAWMETSSKQDAQNVNELFERMLRESLEWADPFRVHVPVREEPSGWFVPPSLSTQLLARNRTLDCYDDGGGGQSRSCVLQ
ncbi:Ras subfamily protein [Acanthamoeba castellanii str. Neff]|uniref:Ras subfamily protein n=1 Tax=Acanthamoeba castellanii (strain ATCC 30010 / Neff) TaxID=1257118 RepID=L8H0S4_ACACF|nr:Ras subfamily protein [Acanthamoeba castellanii str. Neff]ELR18845.1 Ras subfamily protein [Acanthamoeba castellanii str. Neff]